MTTGRRHIPLKTKLAVALRQLGLDPETAELDHCPALELRERTPDGGYIPDANDPEYLQWLSPEAHNTKTNGRGGEKRITTRGADHGEAAHLRELVAGWVEFRQRLLAKEPGMKRPTSPRWPKQKLRGRGFERRNSK